jgi:hypothetical protein
MMEATDLRKLETMPAFGGCTLRAMGHPCLRTNAFSTVRSNRSSFAESCVDAFLPARSDGPSTLAERSPPNIQACEHLRDARSSKNPDLGLAKLVTMLVTNCFKKGKNPSKSATLFLTVILIYFNVFHRYGQESQSGDLKFLALQRACGFDSRPPAPSPLFSIG